LTPNVFYFSHDQGDGKRGALGSLAYQYEPRDDFTVISEIGFSRGLGGAVTLDYNRDGERFYGAVRYEPPNFASLSINNFRGLFSDLFWTRQIGPRLRSDITVSSSRYNTTRMQQRNTISNFGLQYQINRWLTLHGGGGYSSFRSRRDDPSPVSTLAAPIGINVHLGRIGGGLQYQYGHNTGRDLGSQQLRASLYGNWRGFNLSTSMDRQTFVPTAGQIVAEIPGLQQILDRMGVSATTPGELAELIRQNAMLAALGYAEDLVVNLSPLRLQYWGMVGWSGKRQYAPRFSLSSLYNRNESVNAIALNVLHSGTYIQKLSGSTDFFLTYSRMRTVFSGRPSLYRPVVTASLRRRLQRTPPLLLNGGRGTIAGIVFQDDQARGRYQVGMSGLEGVEVVLDGGRKTRTDRSGRFHFSGVSYGEHKVEVNFSSSRPFFFSTSSYAVCSEKGRLEFGIGYARSRIIGYARTDSGQPLAGLEVRIESAGVATGEPLKVQTDGVGRFEASGLESGVYTVSIEPQTVPPGYALGSINAETVKAAEDSPGRIQFVVPAYRNLGGQVRAYDKVAAAYVPMPRLTVELRELAIKTITDANGGYLFRNLPPGDYTVAVTLGGREFLKKATMPDEPTFLKGVDISIVGR
jgi:hypothetical protein